MKDKYKRRKRLEYLLRQEDINIEEIIEIVPELKSLEACTQNHPAHCWNVLEHTLKVVAAVPDNTILKISALLHDIGKPAAKVTTEDGIDHFWGHEEKSANIAQDVLVRLGYEETLVNRICRVIELHDIKIDPSREGIHDMLEKLSTRDLELLLKHQRADLMAHSPSYIERKIGLLGKVEQVFESVKSEIPKQLDEEEIEYILGNVKASLAMEGHVPSEFSQELARRYLRGAVTSEEAIALIKENLGLDKK